MSAPEEFKQIIRFAQSQGWHVDTAGSGHTRLTRPDGVSRVIPSTPSEYRSLKNTIADLRRFGLDLPRKRPKPKAKPEDEKVQESKYMRREACKQAGVTPVLDDWPNVQRILGQWRSPAWFDENGTPIPDHNVDDFDLACFMSLRHISAEITGEDVATWELSYDAMKASSVPTGKRLRIMVDVMRYWAHTRTPPRKCSCGKTFIDPDDGAIILATHLVNEHERGHVEHEPVHDDLRPYVDPNALADIADDPLAEEVETLKRTIERMSCDLQAAQRKFKNLRGDILAIVERAT